MKLTSPKPLMAAEDRLESVRRRYDRLAKIYSAFNLLFFLTPRARATAVSRLELKAGERVLEVACGTGCNLPYLSEAATSRGEVVGIDISDGMLRRARRLCERRQLRNVTLQQQDATQMHFEEPFDAVLFCVCYSVIPNARDALAQAWKYLRKGGRVVILDGKIPSGSFWKVPGSLMAAVSKATVLGNINVRPWDDLSELASHVEVEELTLGTYYICRATKPH